MYSSFNIIKFTPDFTVDLERRTHHFGVIEYISGEEHTQTGVGFPHLKFNQDTKLCLCTFRDDPINNRCNSMWGILGNFFEMVQ